MTLQTEPLAPPFKKAEFTCGKDVLDIYLKNQANQDKKNNIAQTFVLPDGENIHGFYTLSSISIRRESIPGYYLKKMGRYKEIPATLIGRLAVDLRYQGKGLGPILLVDALARCFLASLTVGSFAVVVDPLDEDAVRFYKKFGFIELDSGKMFLPMKTLEPMVQSIIS